MYVKQFIILIYTCICAQGWIHEICTMERNLTKSEITDRLKEGERRSLSKNIDKIAKICI